MGHSEEHRISGHQLFGSRKGKSTYDALVTVWVIYDMARVQRNYIVSMFNDLICCYDRTRPALNTVTTRRMGLPKTVAVCHTKTLRLMKHYIRTGYGISKECLQWDESCNSEGSG
jgi:hypothetical protein